MSYLSNFVISLINKKERRRYYMITLLLDSSNKLLVVGLAKDNKIIDYIIYEAWQRQSEYMINEINNIFTRNNINPKNVNEIIVTKGPGSYTGLRIALTIAKIYGYILNIPVYTLSSLEILIDSKDENINTICLMNARSSRSYIGIYSSNKDTLLEDKVLTNEEVIQLINDNKTYKVSGDVSYLKLDLDKNNYLNLSSLDLLNNMLYLKNEKNKVSNILTLKAIYLKD